MFNARFKSLLVLALCTATLAPAQVFTGSDDFSGDDSKWAYFFRRTDSVANNGDLTFNGTTLGFSKGAGAGSYILGWDGTPAEATARGTGSYTTDWVMDVTATNLVTTTANEFVATGIEVSNAPGAYTAIVLGTDAGTRWVKIETNVLTSGTRVNIPTGTDVRLRLAWNATARNLTGSYSLDGGANYLVLGSLPITHWPTLPTSGFFFEAFGNSNLAAALPAGQVSLDNFSVRAATMAGSDDFNGDSSKWAGAFRTTENEHGANGVLTFTGSVLEFTKSTGTGSQHLMWDGDGIRDNGAFLFPGSFSTSWVMEATATNTAIAEGGKFASIGIEVAIAPGSYTGIMLENFGGELSVLGETNSWGNFESVPAPANTPVRLRLAWDAEARALTGSYSFNGGASFTTLASVPISLWPISPASTGFVFETFGYATSAAAVSAGQMRLDDFVIRTAPAVTTQPVNVAPAAGTSVTLSVATTSSTAAVQWQQNGTALSAATGTSLTLAAVEPASAGIYEALITDGAATTSTDPVIVGVQTSDKVLGTGEQIGENIHHANGNIFDQVLLEGGAATITADPGEVTRMSFLDPDDDIVQVEFSGAGTVTVTFDGPTAAAAPPTKYKQESVSYVKGNAQIVVTGANASTYLTVFSVGRGTAVNQALFFDNLVYDGQADVAYIAISSTDGKFAALRAANVTFSNSKGLTGVYAPGVDFPIAFVGDIDATGTATPVLLLGSSTDARVTGGDLAQTNGRPVKVSGVSTLSFTAGTDSHSTLLPAKANAAVLEQDGVDVTTALVHP